MKKRGGSKHTIQNLKFPCIFALKAYKIQSISQRLKALSLKCCNLKAYRIQSILFLFIPINQIRKLINGVMEYTEFVKITPIHKRIYNPLVIFFQNQFTSLVEEQTFAWQQLLLKQWLDYIPMNPNDSRWSFCFNEVELFFNVSCPHHKIFRNRNLGDIAFVINPRENFDYVASGGKKQGIHIREIIRDRVKKYNNNYLPKDLGFFGFKGQL
ncbi:YqcI/YcgG family protein [Helicobacter sp. MIT 14-3879]|uniref:YqcI/YcgG family protein n=1 Tax=Helicobacter sp. MIT 14-3879 TaxID=2040649 RepID=UPI000E1EF31B|nr:YqcI/YcgG family protein [Helicobacter sp. MIT 14-3879]RDU60624.1 YqcI/YcgG family protein [Helicobacter sp. MIT 14-3879]